MQAIVLAGGLGTRLRAAVPDLPKPLAPINGEPFLAVLLRQLQRVGVTSVVLSVGYRHELIRAALGERFAGLPLTYAVETTPLGTGGAIRLAAQSCTEPEVVIVNGDSFLEVDLAAMREAHRAAAAQLTVAVVEVPDVRRYGSLVLDGHRIASFAERGGAGPTLINGGVYVMPRELLVPLGLPEAFSFERDVLVAKVAELRPLAFRTGGTFIDIGVPEDFARAQALLAGR